MPTAETIHRSSSAGAAPHRYRHFVIGAVIYLLLYQFGVLFVSVPTALAGFADFRNLYTAGFMVRTGTAHQLYDFQLQHRMQSLLTSQEGLMPFIHPAYAALLFLPLSFLSYRVAYCVFFAINLGLLWLSARLMRDSLPHLSELWTPLPLLLFFSFFPAAEALMQGQTSILLLTLFCAAFASLRSGNPLRAGVFLGLAILKLQIALPLFLLLALRRRLRLAAGFLAGATTALAASLATTGYSAFVAYWRMLFRMAASAPAELAAARMPPEMMPNLQGLGQMLAGGAAWGSRLAAIASVLLFLGMISRRRAIAMPPAVVCALLLSPYMGVHDLVLLLLPISLALDYVTADASAARAQAMGAICLVLLCPALYLFLIGRHLMYGMVVAILAFLICLTGMQWEATERVSTP